MLQGTASAAPAVSIDGLTKRFPGGHGVFDLGFSVERGEVFAYLGPNGAGKTTTIRLLLDLIRPTAGQAAILGLDCRRDRVAIHRRLGYLPGDLRLYPDLSGSETVGYFAHLREMRGTGEAPALAERFELDLDRPVGELSRGNRQKVGLLLALMHRPDLLVLDEPTSGLDPMMQQVFHEMLRAHASRGGAVLLSSHVLSEVQHVADRVGVIRDGRLELVESVASLRARAVTRVEVAFATPPPDSALSGLPGVSGLERQGSVVRFALRGSADPLIKALAEFTVLAIESHEADLEDIFLAMYEDGSSAD